jgi:hypothetical protein
MCVYVCISVYLYTRYNELYTYTYTYMQVSGGAVCVKSVNKGGAAYASGMIMRGDVLYAIDGQKVIYA